MQSPDRLPPCGEPWADYLPKETEPANFVSDVAGVPHGKILYSSVPHALIRSIDATSVLAMSDVVAVLTGGVEKAFGTVARVDRDPCRCETEPK